MGNKNCKNCGRLLQPEDNYCPQCGQSAKTKRLQIKQVRKDVFKNSCTPTPVFYT
ncbi:MAG: zinc-ribbon domain-containing protein [Lewinellaceae bacterium]|nr:zinc-ribbon domain-containing protein [Lewinellaceae bacterium]